MFKFLYSAQRRIIYDSLCKTIYSPIVAEVREELMKEYNTTNLEGFCNEASSRIASKIQKRIDDTGAFDIIPTPNWKFYCESFDPSSVFIKADRVPATVSIEHGELAHRPLIESCNWPCQHTWVHVTYCNVDTWIDATSCQFKDIIPEIPDFIISPKPIKYFMPDRKNIAWNKPFMTVNKHLKIKHKNPFGDTYKEGIIEFCQYEIWGRISDFIRRIIH